MAVELGMCTVIVKRSSLQRAGVEAEYLLKVASSMICAADEHLVAMDTMGGTAHLVEPLLALGLKEGEDIAAGKCDWLEFGTLGQDAAPIFHARFAQLHGATPGPLAELPMLKAKRDKVSASRPWLGAPHMETSASAKLNGKSDHSTVEQERAYVCAYERWQDRTRLGPKLPLGRGLPSEPTSLTLDVAHATTALLEEWRRKGWVTRIFGAILLVGLYFPSRFYYGVIYWAVIERKAQNWLRDANPDSNGKYPTFPMRFRWWAMFVASSWAVSLAAVTFAIEFLIVVVWQSALE